MVIITLRVSGAVQALAADYANEELASKVDYSRTELEKCRDNYLRDKSQLVLNEANNVIATLSVSYGVTVGDIVNMQTLINTFEGYIPKHRGAKSESMTATKNIISLFRKADYQLIKKMDLMMEQFRATDPDLFSDYANARVIIDSGIRHEGDAITPPPV